MRFSSSKKEFYSQFFSSPKHVFHRAITHQAAPDIFVGKQNPVRFLTTYSVNAVRPCDYQLQRCLKAITGSDEK